MNKHIKLFLGVFAVLIFISFIIVSSSPAKGTAPETKRDKFDQLAKARFADIKTSLPEVSEIKCISDSCDSVVYFNFSKLPDDFEFIIRGNTATFSKFKLDNTGVSHVTVIGEINGREVLTCNGSSGKVDSCK